MQGWESLRVLLKKKKNPLNSTFTMLPFEK